MRFEIKSHKFAVSLFIIEIHFSGGKLKLSHKKRVMKMREKERECGIEKGKKIKVTFFCVLALLGVTVLGEGGRCDVKRRLGKTPAFVFCLFFSREALVNTIFLTMTRLSSDLILNIPREGTPWT